MSRDKVALSTGGVMSRNNPELSTDLITKSHLRVNDNNEWVP
jgi:hypothetical protein